MTGRSRSVYSVRRALIEKSRDSALAAVQAFNTPLTRFKSETFIVLMTIAWTYLMHAYYRRERVEYRYSRPYGTRRRFERTESMAFKFWELSQCLSAKECPLDAGTINNLRFLIGLRNEIEHHLPPQLDDYVSSRYMACAMNYEYWLTRLFGDRYSCSNDMALALHFRELQKPTEPAGEAQLPSRIAQYIRRFDESLSTAELDDERFAYRLVFVRKAVGKIGQADRVVDFVDPDSSEAAGVPPERWVKREVERPKYRAGAVCERVVAAGYHWFTVHLHTNLWKALDAKNPGRGYGTTVGTEWFWYQRWIDEVIAQCARIGERGITVTPKLWGPGFRPRPRPIL